MPQIQAATSYYITFRTADDVTDRTLWTPSLAAFLRTVNAVRKTHFVMETGMGVRSVQQF